jgi:hypothetical protein
MYFIGLDVHKKTISYCVKGAAGRVYQEGKIGSTRWELDEWIRTMPQPRTIAMEATIFTGWIYDHLLPHAEKVKVAHPSRRGTASGGSLRIVSGLAANTNSIICDGSWRARDSKWMSGPASDAGTIRREALVRNPES